MTYSIQDSSLRFSLNESHDTFLARLEDFASETTWGPTPPVGMEVFDIPCRRVDRVAPSQIRVRVADGATIELEASHEHLGLSVVVLFSIDRGELVAKIPSDRVRQRRPHVALLAGIHLLPRLMEVDRQHPGHLVLPLQSGALCYPERHQEKHDAFLIYGQQERWEDLPLLPCCGVVRETRQSAGGKRAAAVLAIATSGECDAECKVALDGHGGGGVGFSMRYLYTPIDPIDPIDRVVRYVALRDEDANYAGMGRRMFRHVGEISGRGTLKERAAANPLLEYAATAYTLKIFHAHKEIGSADGTGAYRVWTTFDQAAQQLTFLRDLGIERVWVQNVGWNFEGHDGMWPTHLPVNEEAGGESGFRRFIAHGKSLGYQMSVHDNYTDHYRRSPAFDPDHCVGSIWGGPLKRGCWSGGTNYLAWGLGLPDRLLGDRMRDVQKLGIDGVYYIDAMGNPLEISYNLAHGERRYRRANAEGIVRILKTADEIFGGSATEAGFLYCAAHTDSIAIPFYPALFPQHSPLIDVHVPLFSMAVKGHVFYDSDVLRSYVVDGPCAANQTMATRMLEMAEVGMKPRTETSWLSAAWGCYPVEACADAMKLEYDLMLRRLKSICLEPLVDHSIISGDRREGNHLMRSVYGDGTEVVCDYGRQRLEINGEPYALPVKFKKQTLIPIGERPARFGGLGVDLEEKATVGGRI